MSCEYSVAHQYHPVFVEIVPQGLTAVPPADINNLQCANIFTNVVPTDTDCWYQKLPH